MDIPVYLVNGFLESGKTSFINTTLSDEGFTNGERTLLIVCEEGIEEYDAGELKKKNVEAVYVDDRDGFSKKFLEECQQKYSPERVLIELNGVWKMEDFLEMDVPKNWVTVQIITLVDASTYNNYLNNMRGIIMEQIKYSDTIIFNRCDKNTKKNDIRRSIKPLNRKAQIIYETEDGIDMGGDEDEELPFDINADPIIIEDDDFGLWYLDALDFPRKYEGKNIEFKAMFFKDPKMPKDTFIPGRFAMQCCADDIGFIGFLGRVPNNDAFMNFLKTRKNREWIYVKAKVRVEFKKEYRGKGPVLYIEELNTAEPAAEDIVYFT